MPLSRRDMILTSGAAAAAWPVTGMTATSPANAIIAVEREFDAYTAKHGYHRGFQKFSTPDSVGFDPAIFPYNKRLTEALNKTPPPPEAPSKLRWWPYRVGVSKGGDLGYDLGGWQIDGKPGGGWFFTLWQKQASGLWMWPLDAGAGASDDTAAIPPKASVLIDPSPTGKAFPKDISAFDTEHNTRIAADGPVKTALRLMGSDGVVGTANRVPAKDEPQRIDHLKDRPLSGYVTRGGWVSKSRDLACSYGDVRSGDDAFAGSYIRLWRSKGGKAQLHIDLFHPSR